MKIYFPLYLLLLLFILYCAPNQYIKKSKLTHDWNQRVNPLIYKFNEAIDFQNISEGDINNATDFALKNADKILDNILANPDSVLTFENIINNNLS